MITTDGGPEFMSVKFKQALRDYGVHHRVSTPHNPHANCRAELGVKTMKRIIRENVGSDGNLRTPKFVKAMLQYKNTPDRDWGVSPAECIFGRQLTDYLPVSKQNFLQNSNNKWRRTLEERERALKPRYSALEKRWRENTKKLRPLDIGDRVTVQDRHGNTPNRWSRCGTVVGIGDFDDYTLKLDGSRATTRRNRRHLRKHKGAPTNSAQWPDWTPPATGKMAAAQPAAQPTVQGTRSDEPAPTIAEPAAEDEPAVDVETEVLDTSPDLHPEQSAVATETQQRVSTRSTKGQSTRYNDYDMNAVDVGIDCLVGMQLVKVEGGTLYYNFIPDLKQ